MLRVSHFAVSKFVRTKSWCGFRSFTDTINKTLNHDTPPPTTASTILPNQAIAQNKTADQVEEDNDIIESTVSIDTLFARAGCEVSDSLTGAVIPPLYFSTTYERDENLQLSRGFDYARTKNPTRSLLQDTFTKIEKGKEAFSFSSGMQAATSIILCFPNAHIILPDDLYHGIYVILVELFSKWKVTYEKVDMTKHDLVKERLTSAETLDKTIILWMETPSNPLCKVTDVEKLCRISKKIIKQENLCIVVDSTWSTPYLLQPLDLGADIVLHSTTKYINGHSDILGGIAVVGDTPISTTLIPSLRIAHQIGGGVSSPFDAWMTLRGLRTLPVRMKAHCENAMVMAEFLQGHAKVQKVLYPGLITHPQHKLASTQMDGKFGGMLSFLVKSASPDSDTEALKVIKHLKIFKKATSLGGTESLIEHRASIEGKYATSPKNLLRISVGLEAVEDLIADLDIALHA
eukprot:gene12447-16694_t